MVVGDWWVVRNNPDGTTEVLVVLEYKDIHDYYKSLNDYRLGDQVTRMIKTNAQLQGIMVGGSINWLQDRENEERVRKSTLHMQFVDKNLRVFFCPDSSHVANDLVSFCKYAAMYADGVEWFTAIPEVHQIKEKCKKRALETQPDVWTVQLNVPAGVGPGKAEAIERKYPSVCHYLAALKHCESEKERELLVADIMCPSGKGERRIGDAMSKRLYQTTVPLRKPTDNEDVLTRQHSVPSSKAAPRRKK
jgi:ERCC4-type nuclease